jgi:opacity protein-like surface antigen
VQAGYGFGRADWTDFVPSGRQFDANGWLGGGTAGVNAQAGVFVAGVEGEWMWTGIKGSRTFAMPFGGTGTQTSTISSRIDWLSMASLRAGFVAADRWLVYGKAGVALASERHTFDATQIRPGVGSATIGLNGERLHTGFVVGAGVEHAFWKNWSAKLEYNYINFRQQAVATSGPETVNTPPLTGTLDFVQRINAREELHLIKFGVNYHFSPEADAIAARY